MSAVTTKQPDPRVAVWRDFRAFCRWLSADSVLMPPLKDGLPDRDATTRDSLVKINHWSDIEVDDIPRLAALTDGFGRFISDGDDATVITAWHHGNMAWQIDGAPCEEAVHFVTLRAGVFDAEYRGREETSRDGIVEPRGMMPELAALSDDFERRQAGLPPKAANDNKPSFDGRLVPFLSAFGGAGAFISGDTLYGAVVDKSPGQIKALAGGEFMFVDRRSARLISLPPVQKQLTASPFLLVDPAAIPEREWLFGKHYIRRYLSMTVGAGGGGKSAHAVSEALAMVTGRPLLDPDAHPTKPLRVWYVNAEDPQDEITRRFVAAAKHFNVTEEQIADRLFTDSGREQEFVIMRQEGRDFKVCEPMISDLLAAIKENNIDVIIVDPFVSTHEVPENDNNLIQRVAKAWRRVADEGNCSVELIHHVTKGNFEVTADSARGGGALKDAARSVRTINGMTKEEAEKAGVEDHRTFFRVDFGKFNMVAAASSAWRKFVAVPLMNGKGLIKRGDEIGVVEGWRWPSSADAVEGVSLETLEAIKRKIERAGCRDNVQSGEWVGYKIAEALQMNMAIPEEKRKVRRMVEAWKRQGHFAVEMQPDYKGIDRPCIVPVFHTS